MWFVCPSAAWVVLFGVSGGIPPEHYLSVSSTVEDSSTWEKTLLSSPVASGRGLRGGR